MILLANQAETFYFRQPWPAWALALFLIAAAFFTAFLYRSETGLSVWKRVLLGSVRAVIFALLILIFFEPVGRRSSSSQQPGNILVLIDVSRSMSFADPRQSKEDLEEAALALGKMKFTDRTLPAGSAADLSRSRLDLARGILQHPELKVFRAPGDKHRLRYFAFASGLEPAPEEADKRTAWLENLQAKGDETRLGQALQQAAAQYSGQRTAAIIVLTDGVSNAGIDPLVVADALGIPVFPIGLGRTRPDDVRLVPPITAPDAVFPKEKVPVRVQIEAGPAFVGKETTLAVSLDGKVVDSRRIVLKKHQFEELTFIAEQATGHLNLEVSLTPLPGEATVKNNTAAVAVKIIDQKINVLYVEGRPRWEYRYLRQVLLRDERLKVKFLMTEGDDDLAKADPEHYLAKFPQDAKAAFENDMIILGDVKASYFTEEQQKWLLDLLDKKEGALIMLAGRQLDSYRAAAIGKLLPVNLGLGRELVEPGVHPVPTRDGVREPLMMLEAEEDANRLIWQKARPLHDVPRVAGVKPGATILATLSNQGDRSEPYPLIAWHPYGKGKAMFVATDQLWRLRILHGDTYHARFWGQTIQTLTLARLLGANKRIRLECDRKEYHLGQPVLITASVLDNEYAPLKQSTYPVILVPPKGKGQPRNVVLKAVDAPGMAGMFQASVMVDHEGAYQVQTLAVDKADTYEPEFTVKAISREDLELDMDKDQLETLAGKTKGKYMTVRDLPGLLERIEDKSRTIVLPPRETDLWNNWWVFALLLGLAGVEWFVRRSNDVA